MRFRITIDAVGEPAEPFEVFEVEVADPAPGSDPEGVAVEHEAARIRNAIVARFGTTSTAIEAADLRQAEADRRWLAARSTADAGVSAEYAVREGNAWARAHPDATFAAFNARVDLIRENWGDFTAMRFHEGALAHFRLARGKRFPFRGERR